MLVTVMGKRRGAESGSSAEVNDERALRISISDETRLSNLGVKPGCPFEYNEACRALA